MNWLQWIFTGIAALIVIGFTLVAVYTLRVLGTHLNEEDN